MTAWVGFGRLARAQYIALRDRDYVQAARAMGVPTSRIIFIHILPNAMGPILVFFVQAIPATIFAAAGFSFLGLGVQDPLADWGKMVNDGAAVSFDQSDSRAPSHPLHRTGHAQLQLRRGRPARCARPHVAVDRHEPDELRSATGPLLEVRDLRVSFELEHSTVYAVQGLNLQVSAGERLGVVGESGSGKEHLRTVDDADGALTGQDHRRRDPLRGPRTSVRCRRRGCARSAAVRSA